MCVLLRVVTSSLEWGEFGGCICRCALFMLVHPVRQACILYILFSWSLWTIRPFLLYVGHCGLTEEIILVGHCGLTQNRLLHVGHCRLTEKRLYM